MKRLNSIMNSWNTFRAVFLHSYCLPQELSGYSALLSLPPEVFCAVVDTMFLFRVNLLGCLQQIPELYGMQSVIISVPCTHFREGVAYISE